MADFGLALREQDVGRGPGYVGTPAYMSPEQARGEGHRVDGRSDIFSLGVVPGRENVAGKVICVRLALFAQMLKDKEWTPATLQEVGGSARLGVRFLEETFSAANRRYHQKAARAVLKALLPEVGSDIKGHMQAQQKLLEVVNGPPRLARSQRRRRQALVHPPSPLAPA